MISSLHIGVRWSSKHAGGADRVFGELSQSLPGAGVSFTGAVAGREGLSDQTKGLVHSFAPEDSSTTKRLMGVRANVGSLLQAQNPDVLASHFAMYTFPLLDKLREQPFIMHFHGPWALEAKTEGASTFATTGMRFIEQSVYQRADLLIVLSQAFAELLHKEYGVPRSKIRIVPGAVDLERFEPKQTRAAARAQLGWPTDRPIILSVRRLVHRMGLLQLIEGLVAVRSHVPEVLCCIAGTGALMQELKSRVEQLDLGETVRFLGYLPDELLPTAYRASDLTIVPTLALEGFGLVAAESLASGTPCMVTPIGGLPGVVCDLSRDLILRSGSPKDIAEGLTQGLLGKVSLPTSLDCRDYAVQNFSRTLMASRVADVYSEVLHTVNR